MRHRFEHTKASVAQHTARFQTSVDFAKTRLSVTTNQHILRLTDSNTRYAPEVKGVPFQQNPRFLGRDEVLQDLHKKIKMNENTDMSRQRSCVIHGMGGVGKTQTALEYTYRYRHEYSYIFWVRAETGLDLATSFGNIAQELMPSSAGADQGRNMELVRNWLVKSEYPCAPTARH